MLSRLSCRPLGLSGQPPYNPKIIDSDPQEYYRYAAKLEILFDPLIEFSFSLQFRTLCRFAHALVGLCAKRTTALHHDAVPKKWTQEVEVSDEPCPISNEC